MKIRNIGAGVLAAGMLAVGTTSAFAASEGTGNMLDTFAATMTTASIESVEKTEIVDGVVKLADDDGVAMTKLVDENGDEVQTTASTCTIAIAGDINDEDLPEGTVFMDKVDMSGEDATEIITFATEKK